MFRTAAVVFLLLSASMLWRFGLTDYQPQFRPLGLALGVAALAISVFLVRRSRFAIGASAAISAFIGICATVAAPSGHGPITLFFAALAIVCGGYAIFAVRALGQRKEQGSSQ
jgi:peptidoglycan/LPS O-acetylase OafA/YrhL